MAEGLHGEAEALAQWLSFLSTLIWQLMVIGLLIYFRGHLKDLFHRITRLKVGETEAIFQKHADDAKAPGGAASEELARFDQDGFFTSKAIAALVEESSLVEYGEIVVGVPLLIFSTRRQHTWLVATRRQLFCLLDDERTRGSQRLIQWNIPLPDEKDLATRPRKSGPGHVIDIGPRRGWLYSDWLFPVPQVLIEKVSQLLQEARKASAAPAPAL